MNDYYMMKLYKSQIIFYNFLEIYRNLYILNSYIYIYK